MEVSRINAPNTAKSPDARIVPSLSQIAADQLNQSARAFDAALTERNRVAAANAAAAAGVYSSQGTMNQANSAGAQVRTSA